MLILITLTGLIPRAPDGTENVICVLVAESIVALVFPTNTTLFPAEELKPDPLIVIVAPTAALNGEMEVIDGGSVETLAVTAVLEEETHPEVVFLA